MSRRERASRHLGPHELARVHTLLNLVAAGHTAGDIAAIDAKGLDGLGGNVRGRASEERVVRTLSQLTVVSFVLQNPPNSLEDTLGHDLTVHLHPSHKNPVNVVWAQVKSSEEQIGKYRLRIGQEIGSQDPAAIDQWLTDQRLVLLRGRASAFAIKKSFLGQLAPIRRASIAS